MKEIGEKLKEARESIGVSLEEAASDLKISVKNLQNVEDGNIEAFKDVINIKSLIRDYAKYLGLDKDDLVDEYNEYLFDYTSKISLEDIQNAKNKVKESKDEKVRSPYTAIKEKKKCNFTLLVLITLIIIGLITLAVYLIDINKTTNNNVIAYVERR